MEIGAMMSVPVPKAGKIATTRYLFSVIMLACATAIKVLRWQKADNRSTEILMNTVRRCSFFSPLLVGGFPPFYGRVGTNWW
jgi:hypothetical protein